MQLSELLPALHQLPRADKLYAVQFLANDLASEEGALIPDGQYPIWSPFDAHDAAATLTQLLQDQHQAG